MGARLDLHDEDRSRPAVLDGGTGVPVAVLGRLIHDGAEVEPRKTWQQPLPNLALRPQLREAAHVAEVSWREALHLRELDLQVMGESIDDLRAVALQGHLLGDVSPEVPVEHQQLAIRGLRGAELRLPHACFHVGQPLGIPGRHFLQGHGVLQRLLQNLGVAPGNPGDRALLRGRLLAARGGHGEHSLLALVSAASSPQRGERRRSDAGIVSGNGSKPAT